MIAALLLRGTLLTIGAASVATVLLTRPFGESGVALAVLGITALALVLGEVLPRTYAPGTAGSVAIRVAPAIRPVVLALSPVVTAARAMVHGLPAPSGGLRAEPDGHVLALWEKIAGAIALGHSGGAVEKEGCDRCLARSITATARWQRSCATAVRSRWSTPMPVPKQS